MQIFLKINYLIKILINHQISTWKYKISDEKQFSVVISWQLFIEIFSSQDGDGQDECEDRHGSAQLARAVVLIDIADLNIFFYIIPPSFTADGSKHNYWK